MGLEKDLGHAYLQSAVYESNPAAVEGCRQEQAETLSLQEVPLPEVRGNVDNYEFECRRVPPRAGDGVEMQEFGPPPLVSAVLNTEKNFQNVAINFEDNPNLGQHGLVQSMAQLMCRHRLTC